MLNQCLQDARIMEQTVSEDSYKEILKDFNKLYKWSQCWKADFNIKKCHILEMEASDRRPTWEHKIGKEITDKAKEEKT